MSAKLEKYKDGNPQNPTSAKISKQDYELISRTSIIQPDTLAFGSNANTTRVQPEQNLIELMFKIEGMTCVACSNSIERLMHSQYDSKGLEKVSIVLLTHKMHATFPQSLFDEKVVTPKLICDTVLIIGFGCELIGMTEINLQEQQRKMLNQDGISEQSLDSVKIRGGDDSI